MSWARLDDSFPEHPKVLPLSDAAFRVHVTAICYCARLDTDGVVAKAALALLRTKARTVAELVAAGLWDLHPEGWEIHDYLKYNRSKATLDEQREKKAAAGRLGAAKHWERMANAKASAMAPAKHAEMPPTRPDPTRPIPISPPDGGEIAAAAASDSDEAAFNRCLRAWEGIAGLAPAPVADGISVALEKVPEAWVLDAIHETGLNTARSWKYTRAILDRWEREGRENAPKTQSLSQQFSVPDQEIRELLRERKASSWGEAAEMVRRGAS